MRHGRTRHRPSGLRQLFGNLGGSGPADGPWPLLHPTAYTTIWIAAIVLICAPLAVRAYQRTIAA